MSTDVRLLVDFGDNEQCQNITDRKIVTKNGFDERNLPDSDYCVDGGLLLDFSAPINTTECTTGNIDLLCQDFTANIIASNSGECSLIDKTKTDETLIKFSEMSMTEIRQEDQPPLMSYDLDSMSAPTDTHSMKSSDLSMDKSELTLETTIYTTTEGEVSFGDDSDLLVDVACHHSGQFEGFMDDSCMKTAMAASEGELYASLSSNSISNDLNKNDDVLIQLNGNPIGIGCDANPLETDFQETGEELHDHRSGGPLNDDVEECYEIDSSTVLSSHVYFSDAMTTLSTGKDECCLLSEYTEDVHSGSSSSHGSISSENEVVNEEIELLKVDQWKIRQEQTATGDESKGESTTNESKGEQFDFQMSATLKNHIEAEGCMTTPDSTSRSINIQNEVTLTEGGVCKTQPQMFKKLEDVPEEGVYENQPKKRGGDVARESDRNIGAELPSVGMAKSMRQKFVSGEAENPSLSNLKRVITPPDDLSGGVYENDPEYNADVVHCGEVTRRDILPEQGTARSLVARYKELGCTATTLVQHEKIEMKSDSSCKVEFVSEPREVFEQYEPQTQAGIFESQPMERDDVVKSDTPQEDVLPAHGSAKNMAIYFKEMSSTTTESASSDGKVNYVSVRTGEMYQEQPESGVFESHPAILEDVVKCDSFLEEALPEHGTTKSIAERFMQMADNSLRKHNDFTPSREHETSEKSVFENSPSHRLDVVQSGEQVEDVLPERGTTKNIVSHFCQLNSTGTSPSKSPSVKKQFTPPPFDSAVYENNPDSFIPDCNYPIESGILENDPKYRTDVVHADDVAGCEDQLPEKGYTRNLVSAWRQMESDFDRVSPVGSGRGKEFTPPREEPRVEQYRSASYSPPHSPSVGEGEIPHGSVQPFDLPEQYQPLSSEQSVFESSPEQLDGVAREEDTDRMTGMPTGETTKRMLAKFQHIQAEANQAAQNVHVPKKEKCDVCLNTVYAMEKIEIAKNIYHRSCFRCSHCNCILTPKTFAVNQNVVYCTNHYKQLFARKGNYDEGFGRKQHKQQWTGKDEESLTVKQAQ